MKKPPVVAREPRTLDPLTFGKRLRKARQHFGWTLVQLAERSGVSITTISRAERGQLALGYENFAALGQALQMDMGSLFSQAGRKAKPFTGPVVTRSGKGVLYRGVSVSYEFLATEAVGKQMTPARGKVHARRVDSEDFVRHPGEEFILVLSGAIEVHFDTGEVIRLERGDSLYFDSHIGHAYMSVSRQLAEVIGITSTPSNDAHLAHSSRERGVAVQGAG